jgi:hypothetical protein
MVHSYQRNQHLNANNPLELMACSSRTFAKGCAVSSPFRAAAKLHVVDLTISNLSFLPPIPGILHQQVQACPGFLNCIAAPLQGSRVFTDGGKRQSKTNLTLLLLSFTSEPPFFKPGMLSLWRQKSLSTKSLFLQKTGFLATFFLCMFSGSDDNFQKMNNIFGLHMGCPIIHQKGEWVWKHNQRQLC